MKQLINRPCVSVALLSAIMCFPTELLADVEVPGFFSDHMVLQRDMAVPVWGTATVAEEVTVTFRGQSKKATADADGNWRVRLDALDAGGPDELVIAGANTITLSDVLVGEVWVGSGQSNMAGSARGYAQRDKVMGAALEAESYPKLRFLRGKGGGGWQEGTGANASSFSALLFSFGLSLQKELDVPVGLILGAVGGTPSGRWLTREMLEADSGCQAGLKAYASQHTAEETKAKYDDALARWEKAVAVAKEKRQKRMPRKPAPPITPGDVSGRQIGDLYAQHIAPVVGYGVRGVFWDQGESGTAVTELDQFTVMGALIGGWRKAWGQPSPIKPGAPGTEFPFLYVQKPSGGGCAWTTDDPVTSMANAFAPVPTDAPGKDNGLYRELHTRIKDHPNTAMVTANDLGSGVHPVNKSGYGARAARVALGMVYGRDVAIYGPVYKSHAVEGDKVRVTFDHVGKGLASQHGDKLQGFVIAGEDKAFHWADAVIDGDTVLVSCKDVPKPVAARYGWARNHPWANLFSKDGLPALTFRTDDW